METKMEEVNDWENGSLLPVGGKGSSSWDDEDVENNKVKESWEDEDDSTVVPVKLPPLSKSTRKVVSKASEKKGKIAAGEKEEKLNAMEKKLSELRLVGTANSGSNGDQSAKSIDNYVPITEIDFLEYAELISKKLRAFEHSYYYLGLLKDVTRFSMEALNGADAKKIASSVAAVSNERLKAEREAAGRKRKSGASKKKKIYVEKEDSTTAHAYATLDAHVEHDYE